MTTRGTLTRGTLGGTTAPLQKNLEQLSQFLHLRNSVCKHHRIIFMALPRAQQSQRRVPPQIHVCILMLEGFIELDSITQYYHEKENEPLRVTDQFNNLKTKELNF